jgi:hypothetical protein
MYSTDVSSSTQKGWLQTSDTAGGLKTTYTTGIAIINGIRVSGGSLAGLTGAVTAVVAGTNIGSSVAVIDPYTWNHIALTRSSGVANLYVNGNVVGTAAASGSCTGTYLCLGGYYNTTYLHNGYIQDFRITKGLARYSANFTPPTTAFIKQ